MDGTNTRHTRHERGSRSPSPHIRMLQFVDERAAQVILVPAFGVSPGDRSFLLLPNVPSGWNASSFKTRTMNTGDFQIVSASGPGWASATAYAETNGFATDRSRANREIAALAIHPVRTRCAGKCQEAARGSRKLAQASLQRVEPARQPSAHEGSDAAGGQVLN